ncbi:MAG TPA: MmcQ/YjbR family DNA-binding protein [Candidatus Dormibacteraeota bacterium]|jgi:hypothetical protein|nr:MmcQ/YjbR family DNA-binding protein [Candidatus Dormibacteraeota bacterium]
MAQNEDGASRAGLSDDDVRALVARLPGAEEGAHHGHPDFRVGGRIFATLWPPTHSANVRIAAEDADALARMEPDVYRLISDRGGYGWLGVDLSRVAETELARLLEGAWRLRAPAPRS